MTAVPTRSFQRFALAATVLLLSVIEWIPTLIAQLNVVGSDMTEHCLPHVG